MIRIDDFPHGDKGMHSRRPDSYKDAIKIMGILDRAKVDYLWGVSPLLCNEEHLDALAKTVNHGKIVMHGFDHGFSKIDDWLQCTKCWADGGEFSFYNKEELKEKYQQSHEVLSQFGSYDDGHFIPPFNCYNQDILDVLNEVSNVHTIHTCDQEWKRYNQVELKTGRISTLISELYHSYDYVHKILPKWKSLKSIMTLHWIYDIETKNWEDNYTILGKEIGLR